MLHVVFETNEFVLEEKLIQAEKTNVHHFTHSLT